MEKERKRQCAGFEPPSNLRIRGEICVLVPILWTSLPIVGGCLFLWSFLKTRTNETAIDTGRTTEIREILNFYIADVHVYMEKSF